MCSFILFSPSFEASLVNTTTGNSAGLLKSSNIFSDFCPQNPVLQPTKKIKMRRTVISSLYCTSSDDSMVVQAYVLLDPNKENLYFRQELLPKIETFSKKCSGKINKVFMRCFPISTTPWFSNEGWVRFGRWVLFPSNVAVSINQDSF